MIREEIGPGISFSVKTCANPDYYQARKSQEEENFPHKEMLLMRITARSESCIEMQFIILCIMVKVALFTDEPWKSSSHRLIPSASIEWHFGNSKLRNWCLQRNEYITKNACSGSTFGKDFKVGWKRRQKGLSSLSRVSVVSVESQ